MGAQGGRLLAGHGARRQHADSLDRGEIAWNKTKNDFDWDRTTALPSMLAGAFKGDEPLYHDLRWAREELHLSRKHPGFATALAKLSASIRGRSLDEIFGDDVREQRRTRRFLWMGITVLLLATIFAGWRWWSELQARQEAESARDQGDRLINFMLFDLRDKLQPIGRLDVLDGVAEKAKRYLDSLPKELITAPRLRQQAVIRGNLGGVLAAQGKLPEALDLYQQSLAIAKRLAEQDKSDSGWQRNLSVSYVNVGNVLVAQGKLPDALDAYQQPDKARSNSAANLEDFFFPCPTTSNLKSRSNSES
jgi:tetratricopeptide (TPR) repeat protein